MGNHESQAHARSVDAHYCVERATDALKREHRIIERVLAVLERLTQDPGRVALDKWQTALDFIRNFVDKCHHLKEEQILFPALVERGIPREGGPIGIMLMEHEQGRGYVKLMDAALIVARKDPEAARTALVANAEAYLRLLREHVSKEEQILFNMADEALSLEEQSELARKFEEHEEKEMGPGIHEKYLTIAQELDRA